MKSVKFRIVSVLVAAALFIGLAAGSLAGPTLIRTLVRGVWGLAPTTYSSVGSQTLTPTVSLYHLAPLTALTITLSTSAAIADDVLIFINTVATDTIISDTGQMPAGARTLDEANDVIEFMYNGSAWVETGFVDQSNAVAGGAGSFTSISSTGLIAGGTDVTAVDDVTAGGELTVTGSISAGTTLDTGGNADIGGTLQFGADNLFPIGFASSGREVVCGTSTFTGTNQITPTGLTTVTSALLTMTTDPSAAAGAPFVVTADAPTTSTFNVSAWQDGATAATTTVSLMYCAIGNQ